MCRGSFDSAKGPAEPLSVFPDFALACPIALPLYCKRAHCPLLYIATWTDSTKFIRDTFSVRSYAQEKVINVDVVASPPVPHEKQTAS
jgi:hypothetical protein